MKNKSASTFYGSLPVICAGQGFPHWDTFAYLKVYI